MHPQKSSLSHTPTGIREGDYTNLGLDHRESLSKNLLANTSGSLLRFPSARDSVSRKFLRAGMWIIFFEIAQRLAVLTIAQSAPSFLTSAAHVSLKAASVWDTLSFLVYTVFAIVGAFLADVVVGRFRAILLASPLLVVGAILVVIASYPTISSAEAFLCGLFLLALPGSGVLGATLINFGADLFDAGDSTEAESQESYFYYFYVATNVASVISWGYLVHLAKEGSAPSIPEESGYFTAFVVVMGVLLIGVILFITARKSYHLIHSESSVSLLGLFKYTLSSARYSRNGMAVLVAFGLCPIIIGLMVLRAALQAPESVSFLAFLFISAVFIVFIVLCRRNAHMDLVPEVGVLRKHETKDLLRTYPSIFAAAGGFALLAAMSELYISQACQFEGNGSMARGIGRSQFKIIAPITVIIATPLIDSGILPLFSRWKGLQVKPRHKILAGFILGFLSMESAAILEYARRGAGLVDSGSGLTSACVSPVTSESGSSSSSSASNNPSASADEVLLGQIGIIDTSTLPVSDISAFWMLIPFILLGLGQVCVLPTISFVAYDQVPRSLRNFSQALIIFAMFLGSSLSQTLLSFAVKSSLLTADLNEGNMDVVYHCTAAIVGSFGLVYYISSGQFEAKSFVDSGYRNTGMEDRTSLASSEPGEISIVSGRGFSETRGSVLYKL